MKSLLVKLASKIIKKYRIFELDLGSVIKMNGIIFHVKSFDISQDYFKTDLHIEACDLIPFTKVER